MRLPAERPLIYLITEGLTTDDDFLTSRKLVISTVKAAVEVGVQLIQIREKYLSSCNLFALTKILVQITGNTETRLLINDRADVAKAAGAHGVHLTARSLPSSIVREKFGEDFLIGVSTHSSDEIKSARRGRADFVVFGPVFAVENKSEPSGASGLEEICKQFGSFPILGLGGIDESNFLAVLQTKAAGFAAIRALNDVDSMRRIMNALN